MSRTEPVPVPYWTAQINDVDGGFIVTNYPHPLSEHESNKHDHVVACLCRSAGMADMIAKLLNHVDDGRADF